MTRITCRDKPLALYVFTKNSDVFEDFKNNTSSGSIVLNDVLMQAGRNNFLSFFLLFISILVKNILFFHTLFM